MKTVVAIVLLSCCALCQDKAAIAAAEAACGPRDVQFEVTDESSHPTPAPENGKALIYVVHEAYGTTRVGLDGKWIGALKGLRTYFSASIDPGEHHLCAILHQGVWSHVSLHVLKAEPGETYYFVAHVVGTFDTSWFYLRQVDSDEGKWLIAGAKFSASRPN
jgi:hypothetical protein